MAELKRIDEAENESKKLRDVQFGNFPLEQFSDAGKVANEGDPYLKAAADTELYDLEKRAIQIDIEKDEYDNSSENTYDNSSPRADDDIASKRAEDYSSQSADDDDNSLYYKPKLVTCKYLLVTKNTMLIMMITHYVKWFMDQRMCHIMKTAKNFYCCKLQICHEKTT